MSTLLDCGPSLRGWSHQEAIQVCPWRWARSYLDDSLYRIPAEPLVKGALVHAGFAHYWSWRMGRTDLMAPVDAVYALAEQEDAVLTMAVGQEMRSWRDHVNLSARMVETYCEKQPYGHLAPVAVEHHVALWVDVVNGVHQFVAPPADAAVREALADSGEWRRFYAMGAPWLTTFRADLLANLPDGRMVVIDHKTGYKLDQRKRDGFVASGQMLQYQLWGMLALGAKFGGVHVGFLNFTALGDSGRSRGNSYPPFSSFQVSSRADAVIEFPRAVWQRAELIKDLLEQDSTGLTWPRAFREQGPCSDRYGTCDFYARCVGG